MFGPLPIRILAGITFVAHGLPKFEDIAGTQGFFGSIGLPPELALPIGLLEVIGLYEIIIESPEYRNSDSGINLWIGISGENLFALPVE
jgi:hypothetical protein